MAAQATRSASGQPAGRAVPGLRSTTSFGVPERATTSVPGIAWSGSSTTVQRAGRERGKGRVSVGKLTPAATRQGRRASPIGCEHEQGHGAEARPVVGARARQLLRQLVEQPLPRPGDRHAVRIEQQQGAPPLPLLDLDLLQRAEGVRRSRGVSRLSASSEASASGGHLDDRRRLAGRGPQILPDRLVLPARLADALRARRPFEAAGRPARDQRRDRQRQDGAGDPPLARRAHPEPDAGEEEDGEGGPGVPQQRRRHEAGDQEDLGRRPPRRLADLGFHLGASAGPRRAPGRRRSPPGSRRRRGA